MSHPSSAMIPRIIHGGRDIGPAEVEALVHRICGGLERAGCEEGSTVAAMMRNSPEYVAIVLACRRLGLFLVSVNWHFKAAEAAFILQDSGNRLLLVDHDLLPLVEAGLPAGLPVVAVGDEGEGPTSWLRFAGGEPARRQASAQLRGSIVYTSGTSGRPKGILRQAVEGVERQAIEAAQLAVNQVVYGGDATARALLCAPIYHSASMLYLLHFCRLGATIVLEPKFDPLRTLQLIAQERITHAYMVPTMYKRLLDLPQQVRAAADVSSLRQITSTGAPCPETVKRAMIEWVGPIVCEAYGASETGYVTFIDSTQWLLRPGSVGRPVGQAVVRILDGHGEEVPRGTEGLIYVRQPATPDFTYIGQPQARAAIEKHGLITLGDVGSMDEEGFLFISDRQSDMVISGGVNIYPAEIEQVLQGMPGVFDCAVFGVPSAEFGEALVAAVQPAPGRQLTADAVRVFLRERVANYKVPAQVVFHDQLPRDESGKIFKRQLRDPYWAAQQRRI